MPSKASPILVQLHMLGSFQFEGATGAPHLLTRKDQSLLAYLVLRPGEHPREELAALFWGDSTDVQARASLRTALKHLREQFGSSLLLADRETLQLNPGYPLSADTREFEKQASTAPESAIALYRGDLLPGLYDEWILPERERLRELYLNTLLQLAQAARTRGECAQAIVWAKQLLAVDAANERAHQHLMFCYDAGGDRVAALKQYEACVHALRNELGVAPSPETDALYEQIKRAAPLTEVIAPRRNNVPVPLNSFIGRMREMERVQELIAAQRLVTLTGAGGSGKTRLAMQIAIDLSDSHPDGVWWVELASLSDPSLVPQAVAKVLSVREVPNQPLIDTLVNHLRLKQLLLVLDNCEHLIDACAQMAETLLRACPNLKILATSLEPLDILGETVYQVPTLSLPGTMDQPMHQVLESEAARLFVERASAVNSEFALTARNARAVAQICQRLDGIPLAIELAAARAKLLAPEHIAARLDDRFNLLTHGSRGALPRHQTLRATIDWSYDLLPDDARKLLRRLSVFVGGFTLDAAEAVCSDEQFPGAAVLNELARLVDRSLVLFEQRDESERYRMLETLREYAREKLVGAGEAEVVRDNHLRFFSNLAEQAEPFLFTDQVTWIKRLDTEIDNLRAAIEWSKQGGEARPDRVQSGLVAAGALSHFFLAYRHQVLELMKQILSSPGAKSHTIARAKALNSAGFTEWSVGNLAQAQSLLQEALAVGRELGDKLTIAWALVYLGSVAQFQGDYAAAPSFLEEALALTRELGIEGRTIRGYALAFLGDTRFHLGAYQEARVQYAESIDLVRQSGNKNMLAYPLRRLGHVELRESNHAKANALFKESLTLNQEVGHPLGATACLAALAATSAAQGQVVQAVRVFGAVETSLNTIKYPMFAPDDIEYRHYLAAAHAQLDEVVFSAAWAEGRALPLEQAIEYVLEISSAN